MQWGRTSDRGRCWTTLRASWSGRGRLGRAQGIRPQGERKGRGVGSQECSIICGKELKSPGRLLRVLPRSQLSKVCSGDTGSGGFARPALHRRPGGPEAGARRAACAALPLTIGAGMLPREQLAAGRLFPALGRVRELDLFDFGVFGEETFNGRGLHAWAARAPAPRAEAGDARGRRKGAPGEGQG